MHDPVAHTGQKGRSGSRRSATPSWQIQEDNWRRGSESNPEGPGARGWTILPISLSCGRVRSQNDHRVLSGGSHSGRSRLCVTSGAPGDRPTKPGLPPIEWTRSGRRIRCPACEPRRREDGHGGGSPRSSRTGPCACSWTRGRRLVRWVSRARRSAIPSGNLWNAVNRRASIAHPATARSRPSASHACRQRALGHRCDPPAAEAEHWAAQWAQVPCR
jgi:hypothetical protein